VYSVSHASVLALGFTRSSRQNHKASFPTTVTSVGTDRALSLSHLDNIKLVRDMARAVSCRLPTAAVRVLVRVMPYVICGGHSGVGAGFIRILRFPLPAIPPFVPYTSTIIRGWYNRPNTGRHAKRTQVSPPTQEKTNIKL
jgi:hypothetical protein